MSIDSKNNKYTMAQVQEFGERFHRYMNDFGAPGCTIPRITLILDSLVSPTWTSSYTSWCLQPEHAKIIQGLGLPIETGISHSQSQYRKVWIDNQVTRSEWRGFVGPGVIFIDAICRNRDSGDPRSTDMTKAIYEASYPIDGLMYIFFCDVVNKETCRIVDDHLIRRMPQVRPSMTYGIDSDQFKIILGTELGRTAARFVLGTWGQGVRRIERVTVIAHVSMKMMMHLRFDIGDCP